MDFDITVRPIDAEIDSAYLRLLPEQSEGISRGRLNWRFRENPASGSVLAIASGTQGQGILGINAFAAFRAKLGDKTGTIHQSMDTIVDPVCRGKGLFTRLLNAFYEAAPKLDTAILYGFPNSNSAPGFFGKLGWTRIGSVPFLIKPLRTGYFLKRLLKLNIDLPVAFTRRADLARVSDITAFDARVDRLWQEVSKTIPCAVVRDSAYLNWRLFKHPEVKYTSKAVYGADGAMRAFISYRHTEKHGGRIGYVLEALAVPGAEADLALLFRVMNNGFIAAKVDAVLAWCLPHSANRSAYAKAGFMVLPDKLRPIELHFGARLFGDTGLGLQADDWYISYLDSDTV